MNYGNIYLITNTVNGKQYVGQTTGTVLSRFNDHCLEKRNRYISNAINSYGKDNFTVETIATAKNQKELNDLEVKFVKLFDTMSPNGYNHRAGGGQNGICSDELKASISAAKIGVPNPKLKGRIISDSQRLQISKTLGGQPIVAVNMVTRDVIVYPTVNATKNDGHNPSNVVTICKRNSKRQVSKGFTFFYQNEYANQSGSTENNNSGHAQRIEIEPAKAE